MNNPVHLAEKLDDYESVRKSTRRVNPNPKPFDRRVETPQNSTEKRRDETKFSRPEAPRGGSDERKERNGVRDFFERRKSLRCYECQSTSHLRPNCPRLKEERTVEALNHIGPSQVSDEFLAEE